MSNKHLLVYFSFSGNIKSLIPMFENQLSIDIARLESMIPYPKEVNEFNKRYLKEMDNLLCPEYKELSINLENYDTIFLLVPNWGDAFPPVVRTFLKNNDFYGKNIIPFISFERNKESKIANDIVATAPGSNVTESLVFEANNLTENDLKLFLEKVL